MTEIAFAPDVFTWPSDEPQLIGADNVLFGSDFPHPEGMYDPIGFVDQLDGLPEDDKAKVMGGNLNRIMKVPALV